MSKAINNHRYRHFKSPSMIYTVIEADALDTDNLTHLVVYRSEYDSKTHPKGTVWSRNKAEFEGFKTLEDGTTIERFTEI